MFTAEESWKMSEPEKIVALVRELECWRLGNWDGCCCSNFSIRNVEVQISCGKGGEQGVWVRSVSSDYAESAELLRPIAEEVARQCNEQAARSNPFVCYVAKTIVNSHGLRTKMMNITVPWNASWSSEGRYEIRPCRWCSGALAIWSPHSPGVGRPIFAKPHMVRQRQSIARMLCTVCGQPTPVNDRWWFALGEYREEWFMTTEAPVHKVCADFALQKCPHLQRNNCGGDLSRFPGGYSILSAIVGGSLTEEDFGVKVNGRRVVGHLKIAWPKSMIRVVRRDAA